MGNGVNNKHEMPDWTLIQILIATGVIFKIYIAKDM